jgi:site-specific recombinase XerD
MSSTHTPGAALVAEAADADPVTRLVLGWLAGKRSENTRTAYARDIGITPRRRAGHAPSWLAWCRAEGVHPVTGVTGLHVALYARRLAAAELSPASAARRLTAVSGWYAWLARRGHITASPAVGIARPRLAVGSPATPVLTRDQALRLVRAADTAAGPQRARTSALVAMLLFTGARVSEVIGADVGDLRTERGRRVLRVTRGDGDRRSLPLPGPAAVRIDAYLARAARARPWRHCALCHRDREAAVRRRRVAGHAAPQRAGRVAGRPDRPARPGSDAALVRDAVPRRRRVPQRAAGGDGARRPAHHPSLRPRASASQPIPRRPASRLPIHPGPPPPLMFD